MYKVTQIKIQESPKLRGVNQDKGITSEDLTTTRILFLEPIMNKIHEIVERETAYIVDQVLEDAASKGVEGTDKIRASIIANIKKIKLDAGGGYTDTHKADLILNGTASGVEVLPEDFVDPKNRGGASTPSASTEVTGTIEL